MFLEILSDRTAFVSCISTVIYYSLAKDNESPNPLSELQTEQRFGSSSVACRYSGERRKS